MAKDSLLPLRILDGGKRLYGHPHGIVIVPDNPKKQARGQIVEIGLNRLRIGTQAGQMARTFAILGRVRPDVRGGQL